MAVRWQTSVRHALGENKGEHTTAPAAGARFTPEDAAKARRHARISICREITMPIPQVTDRIKEAPAVALRAVFAGIGQLLMAVDKIRAQMQEQATSAAPSQQRPSAAQPPPGQADGASNITVLRERATPATKPGAGPGGTKPAAASKPAAGTKPAAGEKSAAGPKPAAGTKRPPGSLLPGPSLPRRPSLLPRRSPPPRRSPLPRPSLPPGDAKPAARTPRSPPGPSRPPPP